VSIHDINGKCVAGSPLSPATVNALWGVYMKLTDEQVNELGAKSLSGVVFRVRQEEEDDDGQKVWVVERCEYGVGYSATRDVGRLFSKWAAHILIQRLCNIDKAQLGRWYPADTSLKVDMS